MILLWSIIKACQIKTLYVYLSCVENKFVNYGNIFTQSKYKEDVFMCFVQIYIQLHALCIGSFLGNAILKWYKQRSILIWKIDIFLLILHIASISYNHVAFQLISNTISHSYIKYIMTFITPFYKYNLMLCVSRNLHSAENREIHYHFNIHTGGFAFFEILLQKIHHSFT